MEQDTESLKNEIFQRLDAIAEKLGVAAGELWRITILQIRADATVSMLFVLMWLIISAVGIQQVRQLKGRPFATYMEGPTSRLGWLLVAVIPFFIAAVILGCSDPIQKIINPEFYAIKEIVSMVK